MSKFGSQIVVILNKISVDLKQRSKSEPGNLSLKVLDRACEKVKSRMNLFMLHDPYDPEQLNVRTNSLNDIFENLGHLSQIKGIDPNNAETLALSRGEGPRGNGPEMTKIFVSNEEWILWSKNKVKIELETLNKLRHFYQKNSARIDHGLNDYSQTKNNDTYQMSKGLIETKRIEKTEKHLKLALGAPLFNDYMTWLNKKGVEYTNKNSAYTATKFLLEKENFFELHENSIGSHLTVEKKLDNQIRFHENLAMAVYTIVTAAGKLIGYPGGRRSGYIPVIKPLHTINIPIPCEDGSVTFRNRNGQDPSELPQSLKYAMRHDNIFIEIHTDDIYAKHADAVDYKSIQSAGGIVANKGKIIAIDNVSGHYRPGWRLLSQAVKKIETENAFDDNAVVGVYSSTQKVAWFFPVKTFKILSENKFTIGYFQSLKSSMSSWTTPKDIDNALQQHLDPCLWTQKDDKTIQDFIKGIQEW